MSTRAAIVEYRDYYDIPRIFVAQVDGNLFLLDCEFCPELDDYQSYYRVYRVCESLEEIDLVGDWNGLGGRIGVLVGCVPVSEVVFQGKSHAVLDFPSAWSGES